MTSTPKTTTARAPALVAALRIVVGLGIIGLLGFTYAGRIEVGDDNPFDFFGYFTNQTSLFTSLLLIAAGVLAVRGRTAPNWLTLLRAIATSCMIIVGVIYNALVPGTGSAPPWVSAILHVVFPAYVVLDWLIVGDRRPLPWRGLWLVLPYPLLWMLVVLLRGATDGWVPYGFLLPERGMALLALHVVGLLVALIAAASLVWWASRFRGLLGATVQQRVASTIRPRL
ncbi:MULTISPECIES: Pr6Pr family membrane protein [unclassified Pseudoclavibacter]|uniref:Pr6Pr family membrane protein n=1 Tax=unclassified Pseudoclavibacter TaxID=2615177 RepID=UPI000CE82734|nr:MULTISPECIES: Pr6Pr family membrane protein [unclassified Pseudoclavibacter]PPF40028.1 hypothetical protein C5E05_02100 [Pseudoclavibacter sp. AY1H1]PPF75971.1 hypothetical protein C5B99_08895 [Pseudoclavibacter sp. Z016]